MVRQGAHNIGVMPGNGQTYTFPNQSGMVQLDNATAGVANCPTASQIDTITHGLGRVPTKIRIYGGGRFVSNGSATPSTFSMGIWCSSGNRCVYQPHNSTITTTQISLSSSVFAVFISYDGGATISGVIQNVTSTSFDIAWTETGAVSATPYMWEAE